MITLGLTTPLWTSNQPLKYSLCLVACRGLLLLHTHAVEEFITSRITPHLTAGMKHQLCSPCEQRVTSYTSPSHPSPQRNQSLFILLLCKTLNVWIILLSHLFLCVCVTWRPTRGCVRPASRVKVWFLANGDSANTVVQKITWTFREIESQCLCSKQCRTSSSDINPPSVWWKEGLNTGFPMARHQGSHPSSFPLVPALDQRRHDKPLHPQHKTLLHQQVAR